MNGKTRSDREERLRAVLRQGDPAGAEPGLAPEEIRRMRRAILSGAAEPRRRGFWLPMLATAAAAALTFAIALGLWRANTGTTVRPQETSRQAVATPAPGAPEEVAPVPVVTPTPEVRRPRAEAPRRPRPQPAVTAAPDPAPPDPEPSRLASAPEVTPDSPLAPDQLPEEPPMRQVQLEAPGGTRVIWMLSTESVVDESTD